MTLPHSLTVDILEQSGDWPSGASFVEAVLRAVVTCDQIVPDSYEVSVVLTDDAHIQILNQQYRNQDKPTNVLSFPQDEGGLLGDIILAYETIAREAVEQNKVFDDHLKHMLVHGCLHLLGFDHETDDEAEEMEALEVLILDGLGVKNPYAVL